MSEPETRHKFAKTRTQTEFACPYCGVFDRDSWEREEEDSHSMCGSCGRPVGYCTEIVRYFTTWRIYGPVRSDEEEETEEAGK